jgi:hypothetical protein
VEEEEEEEEEEERNGKRHSDRLIWAPIWLHSTTIVGTIRKLFQYQE